MTDNRFTAEVNLAIVAEDIDQASALAEHVTRNIREEYGPQSAAADNEPGGVIASATVEVVTPKRPK